MAIKTVTAENVAAAIAGTPVLGAETSKEPEAKAEPEKAAEPAKEPEKPRRSAQERIDELTREKYELDELARTEFEKRQELEQELGKLKTAPREMPAVQTDARPDRTKYKPEEASKYEDDLLAWNRKQAIADFQREQAQRDAQRRLTESAVKAREQLSDFDAVIARAPRDENCPLHIDAAVQASDFGAHLAYHLAKHPADKARLYAMSAAKALLELGKIESQYAKTEPAKASEPTPSTPKVPEPMPALTAGAGDVQVDMSKTDFATYKRRRLDEIRKEKARARA